MGNSYTATRIHCMRTTLIKDYEHLLKMSEKELLGFLQQAAYKEDIDQLAIKELDDAEAIDKIIANNIFREFSKLDRIAQGEFRTVLDLFLEQNDAWNLIVLAEAITGNTDAKEGLKAYARKGTVDPVEFAGAKSIEELGRQASTLFPILRKLPTTLAGFRDLLQQHYAKQLRRIPHHTRQYLIDEYNINRLLLLKRDKLQEAEILRRLQRGGTIMPALRQAAAAPTVVEALAALRTTRYRPVIEAAAAELEHGALVKFEYELRNHILRSIRHAAAGAPLQPTLLISYISEKEIEHDNLRLIIKAKQLGLEESFIREHLVVA